MAKHPISKCLVSCLSGLLPLIGATFLWAADNSLPAEVARFSETYCQTCHNATDKEAELDLSRFRDETTVTASRKLWNLALRHVRDGDMPPRDAKQQPTFEEREAFVMAVKAIIRRADAGQPRDPGRVTIRRLNKTEYNNTIRDLCLVEFEPAADFPPDDVAHGFDNIGEILSLSPALVELYLKAAETVIDAAVLGEQPPKIRNIDPLYLTSFGEVKPERINNIPISNGAIYWKELTLAMDGLYRIAVVVAPTRGAKGVGLDLPKVSICVDGLDVPTHRPDKPAFPLKFTAEVELRKGTNRLGFRLMNPSPETIVDFFKRVGFTLSPEALTVTGPLDEVPESHRALMTCDESAQPREQAKEILTRFTRRAFRRPVAPHELDRYLKLYDAETGAGPEHLAAIKTCLQAVLVSPNFLFRVELNSRPDSTAAHAISEHQLASRLSYFRWNSMPDETLLTLADQGELSSNLDLQVTRMLADWKALSFLRDFPIQWLELRSLPSLSRALAFAEFTRLDRESMVAETTRFFEEIVRKNRPVHELIDARYSFVNNKLAKIYGIADVRGKALDPAEKPLRIDIRGSDLERVDFPPDSPRGGILTHASVLTVTSASDRTSPVNRGRFILENILGSPPPSAPR